MNSLVGYESDEENETESYSRERQTFGFHGGAGGKVGASRDDTNYDDVNMDMSEDSQNADSDAELPQARNSPHQQTGHYGRQQSHDTRRNEADKYERRRDKRDDRTDKRYKHDGNQYEAGSSRRGLLGDKPDSKNAPPPALMDLKPFDRTSPSSGGSGRSHDTRDAVSPRFVDRDRRERERERERDRHGRRSEEKRHKHSDRRSRSRERERDRGDRAKSRSHYQQESGGEKRPSPPASSDYRPTSYKVNKKLEAMEKMGLQIKTPDGSMATAQQLRQAASESGGLPSYYNPAAVNTNKILDQVQKRKLLWANKSKTAAADTSAGAWTGTRFAQDNDGKQTEKFMRLMGIKDPAIIEPKKPDKTVDPIKKQEEMFQAMQAQYEVARATTHTMRGVGLGFQRGQF